MIKIQMSIDSHELYRPVPITVALPHGLIASKRPYKTIWALHCAMGNGDIFFDRLGLGAIVDKTGTAIIAPSLGNGYYVNSAFERQADFLNNELYPTLLETLPLSAKREDNILLGLSMGGFGAMCWALETVGQFEAVAAISGVFDIRILPDERAQKSREQRPMLKLFAEKLMPKLLLDESGAVKPEADLGKLLDKAMASKAPLPSLALYCGCEDYLSLNQTTAFAENCRNRGLEPKLCLSPGGHNPGYWAGVMPEVVDWFLNGSRN
jgi:S-formylglutathione hydrolase FrmB